MQRKAKYWTGVISGVILPSYVLVLAYMVASKNSNVTAMAVMGGFFVFLGLISSMIWASNFYQRYSRKELDIKNYKFPLSLAFINIIIFIFSFLIYLPIF